MRNFTSSLLLSLALGDAGVHAQTTPPVLCDISGCRVTPAVTYDSARQVYKYDYSIACPPTNTGRVWEFSVETTAGTPQSPTNPSLTNDATRLEARPYINYKRTPTNAVTVGLASPSAEWAAGTSRLETNLAVTADKLQTAGTGAKVLWNNAHEGIAPGVTMSGFHIESKAPPALRRFDLLPDADYCLSLFPDGEEGDEGHPVPLKQYDVQGNTVGPMLAEDGTFYDGGGQKPAEVNKFLRYRNPAQSKADVSLSDPRAIVIVFYGPTTLNGSFKALLNGADVSQQFHPAPGVADIVVLTLPAGSSKLQLAIDGTKADGHIATDTDVMTFSVQ